MVTRRRLAAILTAGGHRAFLMEDDPDRAGRVRLLAAELD